MASWINRSRNNVLTPIVTQYFPGKRSRTIGNGDLDSSSSSRRLRFPACFASGWREGTILLEQHLVPCSSEQQIDSIRLMGVNSNYPRICLLAEWPTHLSWLPPRLSLHNDVPGPLVWRKTCPLLPPPNCALRKPAARMDSKVCKK